MCTLCINISVSIVVLQCSSWSRGGAVVVIVDEVTVLSVLVVLWVPFLPCHHCLWLVIPALVGLRVRIVIFVVAVVVVLLNPPL